MSTTVTKLYLVRHAEAEGNLYRRIHGQYDSLVTDNGYRQIAALAHRFENIPVDAVYSSDLFRTRTTARAIYEPKGLPLTTRKALREVSMGVWCNYRKAFFDIVTSNPPYISGNHGLTNPDEPKNIARHEICVTLSDVIEAAAYLLKPGGSFYMIHKPFRLAEIFEGLLANGLEPKRMQLIHPYIDKEPNMVIVEGVKGGNSRIKIEPPLIVYKEPGVYTEQLLATYEGEAKK